MKNKMKNTMTKGVAIHCQVDKDGKLTITESKPQKEKDCKFIFIIPNKMNDYLEWKSKRENKHKSQIVRESIENSDAFKHYINDWKFFVQKYGNERI